MITHIFGSLNDYYNFKFIKFIENYFDAEKHKYLFFRSPPQKKDNTPNYFKDAMREKSSIINKRMIYVDSLKKYINAIKILKESKKIILHSFGEFNPVYFPLYVIAIRKSAWHIWGWDLYHYKENETNLILKLIWLIRDRLLYEIPEIIAGIPDEYVTAKKHYTIRAKYRYAFYPNAIDFKMLDSIESNDIKNNFVKILVGNSADPSNNHIEIFEILRKFKNKDIQIISPLTHGDKNYIKKVKKTGKNIFSDNFLALNNRIEPSKYVDLLSNIDIGVMNHQRQQGWGTIIPLLYLGKKVYMNFGLSTSNFLSNKGVKIFNTQNLRDISFDKMIEMNSNDRIKNKNLIKNLFNEEKCALHWNDIFQN